MAYTGINDPRLFVNKQPGGMFSVRDVAETPGKVFYLGAGVTGASDSSGYGQSPGTPVATLDYAVAKCTAGRGDTIYVMPGHNEGKADAQWDLDVADISVIGLGRGTSRPIFDFDHANASMNIGASNITVRNITLRPSITDVLIGIDVEAASTDTLLEDVEVLEGEDAAGDNELAAGIELKAGCDRTTIRRFLSASHASTAGEVSPIHINGVSDRTFIDDCWIEANGAGLTGCIVGTGNSTRTLIRNCILYADAEEVISMAAGATGILSNILCYTDVDTILHSIVAAGFAWHNVQYIEVASESGVVVGTPSAND